MSDRNLSLHGYDFGDDADVDLPHDAAFDAWISEFAPAVNEPVGEAPRADMWDVIAARVSQVEASRDASVRPIKQRMWFFPVTIAAALLLGIGLDRVMQTRMPANSALPARVAKGTVPATDNADPSAVYRLAAQQTLTQAEMLLTAYRATDVARQNPESVRQLAQWGRQVLGSTRLLIDSPAGDDPRLKPLLEDLEVVLVQIIRLSGAPLEQNERDLIDGAITNRHLLPRIRSAVPSGTLDTETD